MDLGYLKFQTSQNFGFEPTVIHFVKNKTAQLYKLFEIRVFPSDSINITFSNTEDQTNETLVFFIEESLTTVFKNNLEIERIDMKLKMDELNVIEILFKATEINFNNLRILNGTFSRLLLIGFSSVQHSSWVVEESKLNSC